MENVMKRYELEEKILQGIRKGNLHQVLQTLHLRNTLGEPGRLEDRLTDWKYDLIRFMAVIFQEFRRLHVIDLQLDDIYSDFTQQLYFAVCVEDCKRIAEETLTRLCELNSLRAIYGYSPLVQKIIQKVDMDLSEGLTLQYFSDSLNVNPSYLSHLFRRETGMTITDYVTDQRMKCAAELLLTTWNPVKIIAKQVGITDVHYFSRLFKKKTGKTPSRYREEQG